MSKPFSEDHRRAGILLTVMMQHHQMGVDTLAELMGCGSNTITSYRIGKSTIPHDKMHMILEILQPSPLIAANFQSAVRMSVLSAWELVGKSPQTKYTGKKK